MDGSVGKVYTPSARTDSLWPSLTPGIKVLAICVPFQGSEMGSEKEQDPEQHLPDEGEWGKPWRECLAYSHTYTGTHSTHSHTLIATDSHTHHI